jgi:predicted nucleic acid-binding protein
MNSFLTIDASLAFGLIIPNPSQNHYEKLVTGWKKQGMRLVAPTLWAYEMTSVFTKMAHFNHLSSTHSRAGLTLAFQIGIELIPPEESLAKRAFAWTERLGRIAAYDSFYLALAERLDCEFWTADRRLSNAVDEDWVRLAGEI